MRARQLFLTVAALVLALPAQPQAQTYPNRPIRLISPFPAGGGNDVLARIIGAKLADRVGVSIMVENRPGAGAVISIQALARSAPDGYALALSASTPPISPALYSTAPPTP